jgi:trimeric autotransporter adhesin
MTTDNTALAAEQQAAADAAKATADKAAADKAAADAIIAAANAPTVTAEEQAALDAKAAEEAAKNKANAEQWTPSGDELIDGLATAYLGKGGDVDTFNAILQDVGDTGKLTEQAKKILNDTFGTAAAAMIPAIEQKAQAHLAWATTEREAVYAAAGGLDSFNAMQEWAKANLDTSVRAFLSEGLNKGGETAQLAIAQLREIMTKKGATVTGAIEKSGQQPNVGGEQLTLSTYITERAKLEKVGDHEAVKALQARARVAQAAAAKAGRAWR